MSSRKNRQLYRVDLKHIQPQQVGEENSDYYLRANKHQDVVCHSFQEALDAAQTGQHDYVITSVRRTGPVIVVGDGFTHDIREAEEPGSTSTPRFKLGEHPR